MPGVSNTARSQVHTRVASLMFWPSLYACAQRYHMGRCEAAMASSFGLDKPHQHDLAYTYRGKILQTSLSDSYAQRVQMW